MPKLSYDVVEYDAQREGSTLVLGWQVQAQVTSPTGKKFTPVMVCEECAPYVPEVERVL